MQDHKVEILPKAPKFRSLLGPSFILLGLGLGSGELILWPYLTSNFGMGIIWGAILGITLQFFINMEIERYSLTKGESIFVGFARWIKILPLWFIFSTLVSFFWPGIAAASAKLIGELLGIKNTHYVAIAMLILMGAILTLGPVAYKTMEKFSMVLIGLGVPAVLVLTVYLASKMHWIDLLSGVFGQGRLPEGDFYRFLPKGIPVASFLAAFAFSGAGGNLNLAQSFYIKEKGYGMGKYSGKITSILYGKVEDIKLEGARFEVTNENIRRFRNWWRLINLEHGLIFWLTGVITICLLGLLAYATTFGKTTPQAGINFIIFETREISSKLTPLVGSFFLGVAGLMLFSTQTTVYDATSRIMAENLLIAKRSSINPKLLPKFYYLFLWGQITAGIIVFLLGVREPLVLLTTSAVINAFAMFIHIGLTLFLNLKFLEKELKPSIFRILVMIFAFLFFGFFSIKTLANI